MLKDARNGPIERFDNSFFLWPKSESFTWAGIGLKSKIKVGTEIKVGDEVIERVDNYVLVGHKLKLVLDNQTAEIKRRIGLGWAAFGKLRTVLNSLSEA